MRSQLGTSLDKPTRIMFLISLFSLTAPILSYANMSMLFSSGVPCTSAYSIAVELLAYNLCLLMLTEIELRCLFMAALASGPCIAFTKFLIELYCRFCFVTFPLSLLFLLVAFLLIVFPLSLLRFPCLFLFFRRYIPISTLGLYVVVLPVF